MRVCFLLDICTKLRTSLRDLFSGPVPDFSKVHKISAFNASGVGGGACKRSLCPPPRLAKAERRSQPRSSCHPTGTGLDQQGIANVAANVGWVLRRRFFSPSGWLKSPLFDEVVTASIRLAVLPSQGGGGPTHRKAGFPLIEGSFEPWEARPSIPVANCLLVLVDLQGGFIARIRRSPPGFSPCTSLACNLH